MVEKIMKYPTLSGSGWVTSPSRIAEYVLSHYITTNKSQSRTFRSETRSLSYRIYNHSDNPTRLKSAVEEDLTIILNRYLGGITVVVDSVDLDNTEGSYGYVITILITTRSDSGGVVNLAYDLNKKSGSFATVVEQVNKGSNNYVSSEQ